MADPGDRTGADRSGTDAEPAEHARFHAYVSAFEDVSDIDESDLINLVLSDPNPVMAEAAVIRHLDNRAAALEEADRYAPWCLRIAPALDGHELPERRIREWSLLKAIGAGHEWSAADLIAASDWLQRKAIQHSDARAALIVLANHGRTRRVRNAARARLSQTLRPDDANAG